MNDAVPPFVLVDGRKERRARVLIAAAAKLSE